MQSRIQVCLASAASLSWLFALTPIDLHAAFPKLRLEPISQHEIVAPTGITTAYDGTNRLFVTDQRGTVHVIQDNALLPDPFLDISGKLVPERAGFDERGLLGLTFHPDFGTEGASGEGKFYVYYSAPGAVGAAGDHQSVIAEYQVNSADPSQADPASERILMTIEQPQFNHNAGFIDFGPDGYLYVMTGDGGSSNDNNVGHTGGDASQPNGVLGNAQDLTRLLGKVLRIDPDGSNGPTGAYGVPSDNPFVGRGNGVREEIYAYGLRNPWRASFDRETGRLFVADVGQGDVEEINLIESGGNYGWRIKEGSFDFDPSVSPTPDAPLLDPIAEYAHPDSNNGLLEVGISVTGGAVYRGEEFPELDGKYIFGDWSTSFRDPQGTLLGMEELADGSFEISVLDVEGGNPIDGYIQAFGLDERGELYLATRTTLAPSALDPDTGMPTGSIYRLAVVPEPTSAILVLMGFAIIARRRIL